MHIVQGAVMAQRQAWSAQLWEDGLRDPGARTLGSRCSWKNNE